MNLFQSALNPVNTQVNRTMIQPNQGALSTRKAKPVGGKRNKNRGSNQLSAQDLISLFQSMPVPNRGYRNPNADQPGKMGQGMAWFDENNSPDKVAGRLDRQNTEDWKRIQRGNNMGAAAVDFVKQTKGYTGADGVFVPPTMPSAPSSAYGTGSVAFTDTPTRGTMTDPLTGKQVFMDEWLPEQSMVQDTKFGAMPGQENGGALTRPRPSQSTQPQNDMAALFPGGAGPKQGVAAQPAGEDFWAWEKANRPPNTVGEVNPGEVAVPNTPPQNYDYIFPGMEFPQTGSLMQKELARRASRAIVPSVFDKVESGAQGMQDSLGDLLRKLFGDPNPPQIASQYR